MPFCSSCGVEVQLADRFCGACGRTLRELGEVGAVKPVGAWAPAVLRYRLSLNRVLFMTVLTYGLYLFYWFYVTWKQYRDYTRSDVFPVWHALTLLVPIYGLFRTHAHMRSFKELMLDAGLATTISAGWAVVLVMVSGTLDGISLELAGGFVGTGEITLGDAVASMILDIIVITIVAALILPIQGNLNKYWSSLQNVELSTARIGVGEVIFGVIGVLAWADTVALLLSSSYRMG